MNLPFDGYLRRKDAYEAADAAIVLWRRNFSYFIIFFAIPFWICAFCFRMLPGKWQYFSWLFMWYLKPFFDRLILHVISIKFFEPEADIKRLFKGLGKSIWRGLLGDLLWRRFTPFRSATMPIRILETGNKASKHSERKKLLNKGGLGFSFFLTFWGLALEAALLISELLFINIMAYIIGIPVDVFSSEFIIGAEIYFYALWCLNYILVETIYVCMGFGVYINSRIDVEGWDIEIIFKGFAEKLKKKKMLGVLSVLFFLFVFVPQSASAQESLSESNREPPLELLEEVLASPDFGYEKDSWDIGLKNPPKPKERITIINYKDKNFDLIGFLTYILASGLRIIIVIAVITALIVIFFFARKYFKSKNINIQNKPVITILSEAVQYNAQSVQELLDKAEDHFMNKDYRNAWGLCTAAAIISLKLFRNYNFSANATENDCARIASKEKDFCTIVKIWVNFAYGGILPPEESFEKALVYCKSLSASPNGDTNG